MKKICIFLFSWLIFPSILLSHEIEVLSWKPRLFMIRQFLSSDECDYLIEQAKPNLKPSLVVDYNSSKLSESQARTSRSMFFPVKHDDPVIQSIEEKISLITLMPVDHGEGIQVVHYETGGEYRPHHDYFDPKNASSIVYLKRGGQRIASFLMYLNTPEEGGETVFPLLGFGVAPIKGDALLFYDCTPDGKVDPLTFHGGSPVLKGEKWLATKWLRQYPFE